MTESMLLLVLAGIIAVTNMVCRMYSAHALREIMRELKKGVRK